MDVALRLVGAVGAGSMTWNVMSTGCGLFMATGEVTPRVAVYVPLGSEPVVVPTAIVMGAVDPLSCVVSQPPGCCPGYVTETARPVSGAPPMLVT